MSGFVRVLEFGCYGSLICWVGVGSFLRGLRVVLY